MSRSLTASATVTGSVSSNQIVATASVTATSPTARDQAHTHARNAHISSSHGSALGSQQ